MTALHRIRFLCACALILAAFPLRGQNPVSNGGFEEIGPTGFPSAWDPVGMEAGVSSETDSGAVALRLVRGPAAVTANLETGANRAWIADSGEQGAMLGELKGGIRFRYTVPAGGADSVFRLYIIPMSADPMENTGLPREEYRVPPDHIGDGAWHTGIVAYDFRAGDAVKWVQVSPRVQGASSAEWLIDDVEWVERVGPLPAVTAIRLREIPGREGSECEIRCPVKNAGDEPLTARVELVLPEGLDAVEGEPVQTVGPLPPGQAAYAVWRVAGVRRSGTSIRVRAAADGHTDERALRLQGIPGENRLEAERFVLWPGAEATVAFVIRNTGTAGLQPIRVRPVCPPDLRLVGPTEGMLEGAVPGRESRLEFRVRAVRQTPRAVLRCTWETEDGTARGEIPCEYVIAAPPPDPSAPPPATARVRSSSFEILFPQNAFGYGVGWVFTVPGGDPVGVIPELCRIADKEGDALPVPLYTSSYEVLTGSLVLGCPPGTASRGIRFPVDHPALRRIGLADGVSVEFAAPEAAAGTAGRLVTCRVTGRAPAAEALYGLHGPRFCVGENAFAAAADEALLPGLEWLLAGEMSSSDTDIAAAHPHRIRRVPHPHMVTVPVAVVRKGKLTAGLLWHPLSAWADGKPRADAGPDRADIDRPSVVFASPDRFEGHASHTIGLAIPTVPEYADANAMRARVGWPAPGIRPRAIALSYALYVRADGPESVLDGIRAWADVYGIAPPTPLPRSVRETAALPPPVSAYRGVGLPAYALAATANGACVEADRRYWLREMEWSMQGYLTALWDAEALGWRSFNAGPAVMRSVGPHRAYLLDCRLTERLTADENLRRQLSERIAAILAAHPGTIAEGDDRGFVFGRAPDSLVTLAGGVSAMMRNADPDGGRRFRLQIPAGGVFKGMDYSELGYEGQEGIGLVAVDAHEMLRLSRVTGDARSREAGLRALAYMDRFRVPRASQVWEVPAHTPDILAAAEACEAYLEAFRVTGDRAYLAKAVYWETAGIPFLYQWDVPAFPWMRYASIPVFGATWMQGSWFGRPVQWNGLRWAYAALQLAEFDDSYPWRAMAAGVTISAMYQQGTDPEAEDYALWPDAISTEDASKAAWYFAPLHILKNVRKLMGYEPEPVTCIVAGEGPAIHITACGKTDEARLSGRLLTFRTDLPEPFPGHILVCGVSEPSAVRRNGEEMPRTRGAPEGKSTGWDYRADTGIVDIYLARPGRYTMELASVEARVCEILPPEATGIAFEFDAADGWSPTHDLAPFRSEGGVLTTRATGPDPYMVRGNCAVDASSVARIRVRLAVSAGDGIQFFWSTADSPGMDENKVLAADAVGDGEFREYVFEVGNHPLWRGTVTGIRLDPMVGAPAADSIRVDYIRGER